MRSHYHIVSAFKDRGNMTSFGLYKLVDGAPKAFSLTHANVVKVSVSVLGADPEVSINSDDNSDDIMFEQNNLSIRFGALGVDAGPHDIEVLAYKLDDPLPFTIFGRGLKESVMIQMRD